MYNFKDDETSSLEIKIDKKKKRLEENLKFVFQRTIRFLKSHFERMHFRRLRPFMQRKFKSLTLEQQFEYAFYGYYFGRISTQLNVKIEKFFNPRQLPFGRKGIDKIIPKTLSRKYFGYSKLSSVFIEDVKFYLSGEFIRESEEIVKSKITSLCAKWERLLVKNGEEGLIRVVTQEFKEGWKYKLPWIRIQIDKAKTHFLKM